MLFQFRLFVHSFYDFFDRFEFFGITIYVILLISLTEVRHCYMTKVIQKLF
jgi:hypothetical protein